MSTASRYPATHSCHTALGRRKVSVFWRNTQNIFFARQISAGVASIVRCQVRHENPAVTRTGRFLADIGKKS